MSYLMVLVLVPATGAVAGLLAWWVRRTVRLEALRRHHEIGSAVFLQLGVIYAVLLAFVFSEVWGEYNTAANAINQECSSLHGIALLAGGLAPAPRARIDQALRAYVDAVVEDEWPMMRERRSSPEAMAALVALWNDVAGTGARATVDDATRGAMLAELATAHQWRETRLFQMSLHAPGLLWVLLLGLGAVLVGFLLCFGIEYVGSQVVFTAAFAAAIALVLALVQCLDFPFQGALRLPPDDFRATLLRIDGAPG